MVINREEIKHLAELARLDLKAEEEERFQGQLDSVLQYINHLNEVDTKEVDPTAQVSGLTDVWRVDEVKSWDDDEVENALNQGPLENRQIKVKRVL